jgi:acetyl esterase
MKATGFPDVDPFVVEWFEQYGAMMDIPGDYTPEVLAMMRPMSPPPAPSPGIAEVTDETIAGVPVWIYRPEAAPTGIFIYVHGGAYLGGSRALMNVIATAMAVCTGAVVISVEYRLAPENPYPAGLDDAEAVTRWVLANAGTFGVSPTQVVIGGESAGGNLSATLCLRLRDQGGPQVAGQVLMFPATDGPTVDYPSRTIYDGLVLGKKDFPRVCSMYLAGALDSDDPYVFPMKAADLSGLPPAYTMVGGCDFLRDEGLAYAQRLADAGVPSAVQNCAGQPHGFLNLDFPASAEFYAAVGPWVRNVFAAGR